MEIENININKTENEIIRTSKIKNKQTWDLLLSDLLGLCFQFLPDPLTHLARVSGTNKHWNRCSHSHASVDNKLHARVEFWSLQSDLAFNIRYYMDSILPRLPPRQQQLDMELKQRDERAWQQQRVAAYPPPLSYQLGRYEQVKKILKSCPQIPGLRIINYYCTQCCKKKRYESKRYFSEVPQLHIHATTPTQIPPPPTIGTIRSMDSQNQLYNNNNFNNNNISSTICARNHDQILIEKISAVAFNDARTNVNASANQFCTMDNLTPCPSNSIINSIVSTTQNSHAKQIASDLSSPHLSAIIADFAMFSKREEAISNQLITANCKLSLLLQPLKNLRSLSLELSCISNGDIAFIALHCTRLQSFTILAPSVHKHQNYNNININSNLLIDETEEANKDERILDERCVYWISKMKRLTELRIPHQFLTRRSLGWLSHIEVEKEGNGVEPNKKKQRVLETVKDTEIDSYSSWCSSFSSSIIVNTSVFSRLSALQMDHSRALMAYMTEQRQIKQAEITKIQQEQKQRNVDGETDKEKKDNSGNDEEESNQEDKDDSAMDITLPSSAPSSLPLSRSPLSSIQDVEAATASILALSDSLFQMEPMSVGQILHSLWSCSRDHLCILALSDVAFKNSDLDLLSSFTSLASFQLNGRNCSLNDEGMEKLTMCSSLTHLTLSECLYITGSGMKYLSPSCADITFQLCRNINDGAIWKLVTTQKQLHTLTIDQCPITDQGIAFLTQAKKLKSLSITGTKSKKTIINIAALPSSSSSSPNNIAVAINPPPPQVIHHHTITPLLSDDALYWISNTSITLLQLRSCDSMSGSALLYHFRRSHMGNLRKLRVDDCPFITQQNCEHVKQVITLLYNGKVIVKKTQQDMELETKEQELEEKENYSANFSSSSLSSSLVSDLGCIGSASLCSGDHRVGGSLPISEYYYSCYDCDLLLTHHHPVCTYCLPLHGEHRTTKFPVKAKQICACFQECCDQRHSLKASFSPL